MSKSKLKAPVVIDLEPKSGSKSKKKPINPAQAPVVQDIVPEGVAMQAVTRIAARKRSKLTRLFIWTIATLFTFMISIAFWDFATGMMARNIWLGRASMALLAMVLLCLVIYGLRELAALSRMRKIDALRKDSERLLTSQNLSEVRTHCEKVSNLLKDRRELSWARAEFDDHKADQLDVQSALSHAERTLLSPIDQLAEKEIEAAARQVATATALVPLALADVIVALTVNIRMIRRIAQTYGGRTGGLGSWRLLKAVATHLVATGAVAIGDDMLGSVAGGGVLSKVSRRFGEGLINGALTARVGIAAMEVCRPMPFHVQPKPKVTSVIKRALVGFVSKNT